MNKKINKLFALLILISIPVLILIILYAVSDPFKVLYKYESYYKNNDRQIPLNRDFVTTEIFLHKFKNRNFDSFVFGDSRSLAFTCRVWSSYIKGMPFHFDSNGESLFGVIGKFRLLQNQGVSINNCILILDSNLISQTENKYSLLYVKHPLISGENIFRFHYTFLTSFLSNRFLIPFILNKIGLSPPGFLEYPDIFDKPVFMFDTINNDIFFTGMEKQITENPGLYYSKYESLFENRNYISKENYPPLIGETQKSWFKEMKSIFDKNQSYFKIIIYPDPDLKCFNEVDIKSLNEIFGEKNIYNFSGINDYTVNMFNYYDEIHCREKIGADILKKIYEK